MNFSTGGGVGTVYISASYGPYKETATPAEKTCGPFIISTTSEKPDATARRMIRSHVMAGKNRTKPLGIPSTLNTKNKGSAANQLNRVKFPNPCPDISKSGLSVVKFADEMHPYMLDLVFKCQYHHIPALVRGILTFSGFTIIGQALFPIEMCMKVDLRNTIWFEYMCIDAACLHLTLWATQSYFDSMSRTCPSKWSMLHESKTLSLLQHRLTLNNHESISDITIAIVVVLVLNTALAGNLRTAITHMAGLSRMVSMRGGLRAFKHSVQLETKICRADLYIAMATGRAPLFFNATSVKWSRLLAATDDEQWGLPEELSTLAMDVNLTDLWADLKCFTILANLAFQTGRKLNPEVFQEILTSVTYRAMLLKGSSQSVMRVLHLGILAFCSIVFLQADRMKTRFEHLTKQLREAIDGAEDDEQDALRLVKVWCLFNIGLSAVTDADNEWLLPYLRSEVQKQGAKSWSEVRNLLKKFLWIDALHDNDGKRLHDRISVPC